MLIVDSQVHIWEADRPDRPWPADAMIPAWAGPSFSQEQLLAEMDAAGVDRAVLVPPAFEGNRNDLALAAAARHPERFAVMGRLRMGDPDLADQVAAWRRQPGALGLRFTFFTAEHQAQLEVGAMDWLWEAAQAHDVPLMVYPAPRTLPAFHTIARRYPGLHLVIDHLGVEAADHIRDDAAFAHLDRLLSLAQFPNVAVKASGLPEYSTQPYPYRNLHDPLKCVVDAFTPRRVFWGTDFTRLPCSYRQALTMFTEEMEWLGPDELEWIMGRGLCEWLGWAVGGSGCSAG